MNWGLLGNVNKNSWIKTTKNKIRRSDRMIIDYVRKYEVEIIK